ncbi:uncharacterized protein LODBEIA_P54690 [Lodderomyces beijingensis]|uniref:Homeobox domain-containing protein n=1 Tax=Lodderomyces beijingensis TaxID=1775926 RepID=A0ABP0ZSY1_9ASCO
MSERSSSPSSVNNDVKDAQPQKRIRASGEVLNFLIEEFIKNANPSPDRRKFISDKASMSEKAVRIWFQNRRAKQRKYERSKRQDLNGFHIQQHHASTFDLIQKPNVPIEVNEKYSFIDCSSLSVGSWQRIKSGIHSASLLQDNLINLSPFNLNNIMTQVDLLVILSKKNQELNYFFSAVTNKDSRILFRIFYPLSAISSCSLHGNSIEDKNGGHELRINLCHQPKFSVYFFNGINSSANQWSICDDFSEGQQVSQAYTANSEFPHYNKNQNHSHSPSGVPHVIVGSKASLSYLSLYINNIIGDSCNVDFSANQLATVAPTDFISSTQPPPPPPPFKQHHPHLFDVNASNSQHPQLDFQDLQSLWPNSSNPNSNSNNNIITSNINTSPFSTTSSSHPFYQSEDTPQSTQSLTNTTAATSITTTTNNNNAKNNNHMVKSSSSPEDSFPLHEMKHAYTHVGSTDFMGLVDPALTTFATGIINNNNSNSNTADFDLGGFGVDVSLTGGAAHPFDLLHHGTAAATATALDFIDFNS